MEAVVIMGIILFFVAVFFIQGIAENRRERERTVRRLKEGFGNPPDKGWKPEAYDALDQYHERRMKYGEFLLSWKEGHGGKKGGGDAGSCIYDGILPVHEIDDITWNDLEMDRVFVRMDYTQSRAGVECLYHMLRTPQFDEKRLLRLEGQIVYFMENQEERVRMQLLLARLGRMEKYSLYQYLEQLGGLGKRSSLRHYLGILSYLLGAALFWVNSGLGIAVFMLAAAFNIGSYLKEKGEIEPYLSSFAYILGLLKAVGKLEKLDIAAIAEEKETMLMDRGKLKRFCRGAGLVISAHSAGGNPAELIFDYIRMLFHVDLILFNRMYRDVMRHEKEIDRIFGIWGSIDAVISIGMFRASLPQYCMPEFADGWDGNAAQSDAAAGACGREQWLMLDGYHPLLGQPVKNSIRAARGVLVTGSNASGKSTFLKVIALNALMAQTIHTAAAERLVMRKCRLYTSMALRDNMDAGESYYIVEIKAIKRILDAAAQARQGAVPPVLCLVDEVLRGTNTVERIAASTQVLKSLQAEGTQCFAATHDIELTALLKEGYDNYHFEEEVQNGDVLFSYQLKEGRATTRNAIRLLGMMGYEDSIVRQAEELAEKFQKSGKWQEGGEEAWM